MRSVSLWPAILGLALAFTVIVIVQPTAHSLSYASAILVLIALVGWAMEAREIAGPTPPAEVDEEEREETPPGPSFWPLTVAIGVVGIAAGMIYDWGAAGLVISIPLAVVALYAWLNDIRAEAEALRPSVAVTEAAGPPIVGPGGRVLMPVAPGVLAAQAAGGAAIAIEQPRAGEISRRGLLRVSFWVGLGAVLAGSVGILWDLLWPRGITGFGSVVSAGTIDQFPPGTKTQVPQGRFWLVNLTEEQGGPGFLALWWKCPHLGCTVPWRQEFPFIDPATGQEKRGWFRCPCHGSTYDDAGVRVYGPAPRPMDRMQLTIDPDSRRITVNTGRITKGTPDNAKFAVKA